MLSIIITGIILFGLLGLILEFKDQKVRAPVPKETEAEKEARLKREEERWEKAIEANPKLAELLKPYGSKGGQ